MAKFIRLHDPKTGQVELVEVGQIARVQPRDYGVWVPKTETVTKGFGPWKYQEEEEFEEFEERTGSMVVMKTYDDHTAVAETVEEIEALIQGEKNVAVHTVGRDGITETVEVSQSANQGRERIPEDTL